jgi:alkylated DNA repair dioxygenase AlkB
MSKIIDDLFHPQTTPERIPMQDAEVYYLRELPLTQAAEAVMKQLINEVPWRAENIVIWGKTYPQPRLTAWYGDDGANYTYSGIHLDPLPWTDTLIDIKIRVEEIAGTDFNSVLAAGPP